eukprot:1658923-Pleurochrysis_carterae.AAC.1
MKVLSRVLNYYGLVSRHEQAARVASCQMRLVQSVCPTFPRSRWGGVVKGNRDFGKTGANKP